MNFFPPNVTAIASSVQIGSSLAFSSLIEASDLDGNEIVSYRFRDNDAAATSGFFTIRGVRQPSNIFIEFDQDDLPFVRYQAGLIVGNETFSVQVSDGERLSNVDFSQLTTINANLFRPEVTPIPGTVLENERIDASTLFSVSDPDGNPITGYFINDRSVNTNGGHFLLNGIRQTSGQFFFVPADQLGGLKYQSANLGQTELVAIQASDGQRFSEIVDVPVTTTPNLFRPVTTVFNVNSRLGRSIAAESLFSFSDADGNTPKAVGFLDTGTAANSGFFTVNGVEQAAGTFFSVPFAQLDSVRYEVADVADNELFRVFTTDGRFTSPVDSGVVSSIPRPRLDVEDFTVMVDALEQIDFSDLVPAVSNGPALETFQVIDQNESPISARLLLNGERLEQGTVHTLTADEFDDLRIEGGFTDGRSADQFLVRGRNPLFFTDWQEFRVNTEPVATESLTSGLSLAPTLDNGEKFVVTYTFIDGVDDVDGGDNTTPPVPSYYPADADEREDPFPLSNAQRAGVRAALAVIERYADVDFVEVPYDIDASLATTTFGLRRGFDDGVAANARLPNQANDGVGNVIGDIWYNRDVFPETATNTGEGTFFFTATLHEVGHTLGFKHPRVGPSALPVATDQWIHTVMSTVFQGGPIPATFGIYDILELQRLYRPNEEFNLENNQYFFTPGQLETVYDAGGRDTINLTSSVVSETIDLNEGAFSTVSGIPNSIAIAFDTVIENARGGGGADTLIGNSSRNLLFGNGNNDILEGGGGNDVLRGGGGRDTYIWRTGDGRDRIDEQRLAGVDAIHIIDDTALDSLENDLVFRRFGRDLRIDLRFNRNEAQGTILIKDQQFGGSRIETLRLFNSDGDQVGEDIDLDSIFVQANTTAQFFTVTNQQTNRGFIAVPFTG